MPCAHPGHPALGSGTTRVCLACGQPVVRDGARWVTANRPTTDGRVPGNPHSVPGEVAMVADDYGVELPMQHPVAFARDVLIAQHGEDAVDVDSFNDALKIDLVSGALTNPAPEPPAFGGGGETSGGGGGDSW